MYIMTIVCCSKVKQQKFPFCINSISLTLKKHIPQFANGVLAVTDTVDQVLNDLQACMSESGATETLENPPAKNWPPVFSWKPWKVDPSPAVSVWMTPSPLSGYLYRDITHVRPMAAEVGRPVGGAKDAVILLTLTCWPGATGLPFRSMEMVTWLSPSGMREERERPRLTLHSQRM